MIKMIRRNLLDGWGVAKGPVDLTLICDRPVGRITRLARPSVRLSVCLVSYALSARKQTRENVDQCQHIMRPSTLTTTLSVDLLN